MGHDINTSITDIELTSKQAKLLALVSEEETGGKLSQQLTALESILKMENAESQVGEEHKKQKTGAIKAIGLMSQPKSAKDTGDKEIENNNFTPKTPRSRG